MISYSGILLPKDAISSQPQSSPGGWSLPFWLDVGQVGTTRTAMCCASCIPECSGGLFRHSCFGFTTPFDADYCDTRGLHSHVSGSHCPSRPARCKYCQILQKHGGCKLAVVDQSAGTMSSLHMRNSPFVIAMRSTSGCREADCWDY